jgi:hypothetical protein
MPLAAPPTPWVTTEVSDVQVALENFVLADLILQRNGQPHLTDLPSRGLDDGGSGRGLVTSDESLLHQHVLDVLLTEGGSSLDLTADGIIDRRTNHTSVVNPTMLIEPRVLNRDHRLPENRGNGVQRHFDSVLVKEKSVRPLGLEHGTLR